MHAAQGIEKKLGIQAYVYFFIFSHVSCVRVPFSLLCVCVCVCGNMQRVPFGVHVVTVTPTHTLPFSYA